MTPEERAAQIVSAIKQEIPVLTFNRSHILHKEITLQIREAEKEARASMREEAANIAEHCEQAWEERLCDGIMIDQKDFIVERIRAILVEGK